MSAVNKIIAGTIVSGGILAIVAYFKTISRAQAQLQVIPNVSIYKLSLDGLTVKVDALLKNPTGASFKLKYPFIQLSHKNVLVGSSQVDNRDIKIPAYGEQLIPDMMVNIPILSFFSIGYDIAKSLQQDKPITFTIAVITTVDLGWKQVAYEHKQEVTLKK